MELYPLTFTPLYRSYLWGGRRLEDVLGKKLGDEPRYAESWEVVDHGADQSIVRSGPLQGKSLQWLVHTCREELFGSASGGWDFFPLLLKYLDCNRVLSVQVHPDDAYAATMNPPDQGKTEAWYVVAAEPGSLIYAGLNPGVDRETFASAIRTGRVPDVLHTLEPQVGDCIFIPAGTVHALGAGLVVAEIQQSSDTTFRIFDWNRVDDAGRPRPLHLAQGLEVTDYERGPIWPSAGIPLCNGGRCLVECDKFRLEEYSCSHGQTLSQHGFRILATVRGNGRLQWKGGEMPLRLGDSVLIPAAIETVELLPTAEGGTVLSMSLPQSSP